MRAVHIQPGVPNTTIYNVQLAISQGQFEKATKTCLCVFLLFASNHLRNPQEILGFIWTQATKCLRTCGVYGSGVPSGCCLLCLCCCPTVMASNPPISDHRGAVFADGLDGELAASGIHQALHQLTLLVPTVRWVGVRTNRVWVGFPLRTPLVSGESGCCKNALRWDSGVNVKEWNSGTPIKDTAMIWHFQCNTYIYIIIYVIYIIMYVIYIIYLK